MASQNFCRVLNETATISLTERFTFTVQNHFEHASKNIFNNAQIKQITVNLENVRHMDSSALEMLLVLRDHARAACVFLALFNPSEVVLKVEVGSFLQFVQHPK